MIDKDLLRKTVEDVIADTDLFIVDINVTPGNEITVTIDSEGPGVDIDVCMDITHHIEDAFDRDVEDYELEVGSAGITAPMKVKAQYVKNIGNPVEVLTRDGRKLHGTLTAVADDFASCTVCIAKKVKEEGWKRPHTVEIPEELPIADIKSITYDLKF